jgi:hypothetical protein
MDPREEELLLHIAAGTDLLTALAALPQDDQPLRQPATRSGLVAGAVAVGVVLAWWLLGR